MWDALVKELIFFRILTSINVPKEGLSLLTTKFSLVVDEPKWPLKSIEVQGKVMERNKFVKQPWTHSGSSHFFDFVAISTVTLRPRPKSRQPVDPPSKQLFEIYVTLGGFTEW